MCVSVCACMYIVLGHCRVFGGFQTLISNKLDHESTGKGPLVFYFNSFFFRFCPFLLLFSSFFLS